MDSGIYLNLFPVEFADTPVELMAADRNACPKVKELRELLRERAIDADMYAIDSTVYGYGAQQADLAEFGFSSEHVTLGSLPQLASRLILAGFVAELQRAEYSLKWSKQGVTVYQRNPPLLKLDVGLTLYRGFDIQSLYLNNPELDELFYAVVIDAAFTYRDADDQPLRPDTVKARFGEEAFNQLLVKQGDLTPKGKINLEVSRQHFTKLILPFVAQRGRFTLPCGIPATTSLEPIRVVLAGDEEEA